MEATKRGCETWEGQSWASAETKKDTGGNYSKKASMPELVLKKNKNCGIYQLTNENGAAIRGKRARFRVGMVSI